MSEANFVDSFVEDMRKHNQWNTSNDRYCIGFWESIRRIQYHFWALSLAFLYCYTRKHHRKNNIFGLLIILPFGFFWWLSILITTIFCAGYIAAFLPPYRKAAFLNPTTGQTAYPRLRCPSPAASSRKSSLKSRRGSDVSQHCPLRK